MCQPNNTRRSKTSTVSLPMPMQTPANTISPSCSISDQEDDGKTYSTLNSKPLKVLMCSENVFRKYATMYLVYNDNVCAHVLSLITSTSSSLIHPLISPLHRIYYLAQVNGIARRVTMYQDGLSKLGCTVDSLHPDMGINKVLSHVNPW